MRRLIFSVFHEVIVTLAFRALAACEPKIGYNNEPVI